MDNKIIYTAKFTHHDLINSIKIGQKIWKLVRTDSLIPIYPSTKLRLNYTHHQMSELYSSSYVWIILIIICLNYTHHQMSELYSSNVWIMLIIICLNYAHHQMSELCSSSCLNYAHHQMSKLFISLKSLLRL